MTNTRYVFVLLAVLAVTLLHAQKENNIWYFGDKIGLDFTGGAPAPVYIGKMSTDEGCASVADNNGDLLFYTDGMTVWNKHHQVMDNGIGLWGNVSTTQSALIVKKPGSVSEYYIFSPDAAGVTQKGLSYSIVDISVNGGLGKITAKNTILLNIECTEKVTAVKDANCNGYWVITHLARSKAFYSYHITPSGINTTPVISNHSMPYSNGGCMKASPDGSKLAVVSLSENLCLFNFNNATGDISIGIELSKIDNLYGCSFSPNSKLLYTGGLWVKNLYQFDVSLSTAAAIVGSKTTVNSNSYFGTMQLGPDNKLYVSVPFTKYLGVINNPDIIGDGCNYVDTAIKFTQGRTSYGLPLFAETPIAEKLNLGPDTIFCGTQILLKPINNIAGAYLWSTGETTKQITVNKSGIYFLTVTTGCGAFTDTINVTSKNNFSFGIKDTIVCGDKLELTVPFIKEATYQWSTEEKTNAITVTKNGTYTVRITTDCGMVEDSIRVILVKDVIKPFSLGNDTSLCANRFRLVAAYTPNITYLWSTGQNGQTIEINQTGNYWVVAQNLCYKQTDTIFVELVQDSITKTNIGNDTLTCGKPVLLDAGYAYRAKYMWSTGDTTQTIIAAKSGAYHVMLTTYRCNTVFKDTVLVNVFMAKPVDFPGDTAICTHLFTNGIDLSPTSDFVQYIWNGQPGKPPFIAEKTGLYTLDVTDTCGNNYSTAINITVTECNCDLMVPNAFTPDGDELNDLFFVNEYCGLRSFHLRIYDRWGELLFETRDPATPWDGTYKNQPVPVGVYMVSISYGFEMVGFLPEYKGTVTVMR